MIVSPKFCPTFPHPLYFSRISFICKLDFLGKLLNYFFLEISISLYGSFEIYSALFSKISDIFIFFVIFILFFPRSLLFSKCSSFLNCLFFHGNSNFPYLSEHKTAFPTPNVCYARFNCFSISSFDLCMLS